VSTEQTQASAGGFLVDAGNFWFHWRNFLFPVAFLLVFLPGPRLFASPLTAAIAGFLVAGLGQVVRAATIGFKYVIRGGRNRRVYAEDLVTDGLYRHSRNPMYVGNLLILFGVAIGSNSWGCVAVAVPLFLFIYVAIVAAEENFLRAKFGRAFDEFCTDVPRWVPKLSGLAESVGGMKFHWKRVLVKEYGTPFGWILGISILGLYGLWHDDGSWVGDEAHVQRFYLIIGAAAAFWITANVLKRTKAVVAD
jgi:protein-S-isoprenylcysteine O-methyltransferase Ste14